jgi:hypothetical protein
MVAFVGRLADGNLGIGVKGAIAARAEISPLKRHDALDARRDQRAVSFHQRLFI